MAYTDIDDPRIYFEALIWAGNSTDDRAITGIQFQPDWVWIKERTTGQNHNVLDSVRGATKTMETNNSNAEITDTTSLKSFTSDGFTLGTGVTVNGSGKNYVSWNWKSGASFSNSSGSNGATLDTTGIASNDAGLSIFTFTSAGTQKKLFHGLSTAPKVYIIKKRGTTTGHWFWYTTAFDGSLDRMRLDSTDVKADDSNDAPTSALITSDNGSNGNTMVCYAMFEKKHYSKFGKYQGNGDANGTYVHLGFKPAFIIIKGAISGNGNAAQHPEMYDNKRNTGNPMDQALFPTLASGDSVQSRIDFLANGFRAIINSDGVNDTLSTYFYMAFAESPFVNTNGVPTNAR